MEQPQRKTTARIRARQAHNNTMVDISETDISDTMKVDTNAEDVLSALDEVKNLWQRGKVDYVVAYVILDTFNNQGYSIYAPEQGNSMVRDSSVEEHIEDIKKDAIMEGTLELEGLYIDTVRLTEDDYELRIAKVVTVNNSPP